MDRGKGIKIGNELVIFEILINWGILDTLWMMNLDVDRDPWCYINYIKDDENIEYIQPNWMPNIHGIITDLYDT